MESIAVSKSTSQVKVIGHSLCLHSTLEVEVRILVAIVEGLVVYFSLGICPGMAPSPLNL